MRRLLVALVALVALGIALWSGWRLIDIRQVASEMQLSATVVGGDAVVSGVAAEGGGTPTDALGQGLVVDLELANRGQTDLEVTRVQITAHDSLGRTETSTPILYGTGNDPVLLRPGETRPVAAGAIRLPQPLAWQRAEVTVEVQPARPETLARLHRWSDIVVESSGPTDDGGYQLSGFVRNLQRTTEDGEFLNPVVLVSFYNAQGEFVAGESLPLSALDTFTATLPAIATPRGPIASHKVWGVEGYTLQ